MNNTITAITGSTPNLVVLTGNKKKRYHTNGNGCNGTVDPIRSKNDVERIKEYFLSNKRQGLRNYAIWTMGINVGLRAGDLLSIKTYQVYQNGQVVDRFRIYEQKTKKYRMIVLNDSAKEAIGLYLDSLAHIDADSYLFHSQKGNGQTQLRRDTLTHIMKDAQRDLELKENVGTHSMRKTFAYNAYRNAYAQVKENPEATMKALPLLMQTLNHSSEAMTLKYMGLLQEDMDNLYNGLNL